jgi:hypothetical protein
MLVIRICNGARWATGAPARYVVNVKRYAINVKGSWALSISGCVVSWRAGRFVRRASRRRARAVTDERFRTAHSESAIKLPPGTRSTIAAYGPSPRNELASRVFQLLRERSMACPLKIMSVCT